MLQDSGPCAAAERPSPPAPVAATAPTDRDAWIEPLTSTGPEHDEALRRLHALLLRVARAEVRRRSGRVALGARDADDLAHQAAADAMTAVLGALGRFRGESRFTTWAYTFVVFAVARAVAQQFWRGSTVTLDDVDLDQLPAMLEPGPDEVAQRGELLGALRRAVDRDLTAHQRMIFVAIVVRNVPLDALVQRLGSTRNAIYKTLFDARRRLRRTLVAEGYLEDETTRRTT